MTRRLDVLLRQAQIRSESGAGLWGVDVVCTSGVIKVEKVVGEARASQIRCKSGVNLDHISDDWTVSVMVGPYQ